MRKAARTRQVLILESLGVTVRASWSKMRTQQGLVSDCNLIPGLPLFCTLLLLSCSRSFLNLSPVR